MRVLGWFKTESIKRSEEFREKERRQREEALRQVRETKARLEVLIRKEVKE